MLRVGNLTAAAYATAYDAYSEIAKIFNDKAEYEGCATWVDPTWRVFISHVLSWAFGDAYCRCDDVRHATLLSAPLVAVPRQPKVREKRMNCE